MATELEACGRLKVGVVVPTLNAGDQWPAWIDALKSQSIKPDRVLVVDSSSDDDTVRLAKNAELDISVIERSAFDHGGTRQWAVDQLSAHVDIVVFMTQDAILANAKSLELLISAFDDSATACVYGRQLATSGHSEIASHHRAFNYPAIDSSVDLSDLEMSGLRAAFCSNSFAAYRVGALLEVGGFPVRVIFGEDMLASIKLLRKGYLKHYASNAMVYHAHDYSLKQDFRRYFDMGVMHSSEPLVRALASKVASAGALFVRSELHCVGRRNLWKILALIFRNAMRWSGYKAGRLYRYLPNTINRRLSLNRAYFTR